jgi:hypothetical protein
MASSSQLAPARHTAFAALKAELANAAFAAPRPRIESRIPSAVPAIDRVLGGGFPNGSLVTLEGPAGRWSIAASLVASVTRRSAAAIVDDGALYPPDLARSGARLERVLVVPAQSPLTVARAADVLVRSKACRLVLVPAPELRAAVWMRLAGLAHRTGILLVAVVPPDAPSARIAPLAAAAALRLYCTRGRMEIVGKRGLWCTIAGYDVCAEVRKNRTAAPEKRAVARAAVC